MEISHQISVFNILYGIRQTYEVPAQSSNSGKPCHMQSCNDIANYDKGIHCVSAVILDDYHYPVAAVTTIAPAFRLPPDRFEDIGQACIETAEVIRGKLLK